MPRDADFKQALCADSNGLSLHAAVRCTADDRQALGQLCRCITRPAPANERVQTHAAGQVVPQGPELAAPATPPAECEANGARHGPVRLSWAKLLERVFEIALVPAARRSMGPEQGQPPSIERPGATGRGDGLRPGFAEPMGSA